jgi:FAD/FMN-containing dehydrogenase
MDRRTLFKTLVAVPALQFLSRFIKTKAFAADAAIGQTIRRLRPSDPAWPAPEKWERLKQEVGGNLIKVENALAACQGSPDSDPCQEELINLANPYYIGDQPGATQSAGWADAWSSAPSVYAVAARSTADVVAAVNFARENNLRLVVKGGGHSYQGTSNAADSLLIWTRGMNKIVVREAFVAQGCSGSQPPQSAVTVEAGAMWMDVYNEVTTKHGRYVQGGGCATVGVAGLIQSGGFGSFSKNYGMAAAGLLEVEIVTADGQVRIANPCTNADLFWAIKGGGGGSFGVVTKVTLKTHDLPEYFGGVFFTIQAASDAAFRRLISRFVEFYEEALFNPHWGESVTLQRGNALSITMVFQGLDVKSARQKWEPFLNWVAGAPMEFSIEGTPRIRTVPARHWWDAAYRKKNLPDTVISDQRPGMPENHVFWAGNQNEVGIFWHGYASVWLPAQRLQMGERTSLVDALFAASRHWNVSLHFNKGLAGAPAEAVKAAGDTAMNPAVLNAFALAIIAGGTPEAYAAVARHQVDLAAASSAADKIGKAMDELRKIVPDPGSYVSESNFFERSWQQSFWGSNYSKLQAVKAKYDPTGLFFVHHGVGSEGWSADGFTRLT